jgi:hypothetical protein
MHWSKAMTEIASLFKPEILFSKENPLLKTAGKAHHLLFETFDKTARLQLSFAEELLDLNRKRFDALYADGSLMDKVTAQQNLATEVGKHTASWAGNLQEVAVDLQSSISDAANDLVTPVTAAKPAAKAKKTAPKKAVVKKAKAA